MTSEEAWDRFVASSESGDAGLIRLDGGAYAAARVREALAEKDAEIERLKDTQARGIAYISTLNARIAELEEALADPLVLLETHLAETTGSEVTIRRFLPDGGNVVVGHVRVTSGDGLWWGGQFNVAGRALKSVSTRAEAEALLREKGEVK